MGAKDCGKSKQTARLGGRRGAKDPYAFKKRSQYESCPIPAPAAPFNSTSFLMRQQSRSPGDEAPRARCDCALRCGIDEFGSNYSVMTACCSSMDQQDSNCCHRHSPVILDTSCPDVDSQFFYQFQKLGIADSPADEKLSSRSCGSCFLHNEPGRGSGGDDHTTAMELDVLCHSVALEHRRVPSVVEDNFDMLEFNEFNCVEGL